MAAQNITVVEAYYYYERRMIEIARGLGRSVLAWQDIQGYNGTSTSLDVGESGCGRDLPRCARSLFCILPFDWQPSTSGLARTAETGRTTPAPSRPWDPPSSYLDPTISRN